MCLLWTSSPLMGAARPQAVLSYEQHRLSYVVLERCGQWWPIRFEPGADVKNVEGSTP